MQRYVLVLACAPLLVGARTVAPGPQASEPLTDAIVAREIELARGLTREWGYYDVAERVLRGIAGRAPDRMLRRERAELLEIQAARSSSENAAIAFLLEAVAERARIVDEVDPEERTAVRDELDYLRACCLLGRTLGKERTLHESALPREWVREAVEAAIAVADRALGAAAMAPPGEESDRLRLQLGLWRARLERVLAPLSGDPACLERAEAMLVALVQAAGERTRAGLELLLELSDLAEERGDLEHAIDLSLFVSGAVWPDGEPLSDPGAERARDLGSEDLRWSLYETAVRRALPALRRSGRLEEARTRALAFYNSWRSAGTVLGDPEGVGALLESARVLGEGGGIVGWNRLERRWYESDESMRHSTGSRGRWISAVEFAVQLAMEARELAEGPSEETAISVVVELYRAYDAPLSLDARLVLARRMLELEDAPGALVELRDLMRELDAQDMATQALFWPRTLFRVGECYRRMGRPLESAMAHREALERWSGDPEFDWQNAEAYLDAMEQSLEAAPTDPLLRELHRQASDAVEDHTTGGSADLIMFRKALGELERNCFPEALEAFRQVQRPGLTEKAIAYAAQCLCELGHIDEAERELRDYLERYVEDPRNTPRHAEAIADRREALALAEYFLGRILRRRAERTNDPADHRAVVELLRAYPDRHPEQTDFAPSALFAVVLSQIALGEFDAAEASCDRLCRSYADAPIASRAALKLYLAIRSSPAPSGPSAERLARLASLLGTSNELSPLTSPSNLRIEAELHLELGRWAAAERTLLRLRALLEENADSRGELESFVLPQLGHSLLEQGWIEEAFAVLDPLVPPSSSAPALPDERLLLDWYRAVFGWIDYGPDGPFRVSGSFLTLSSERLANACSWMQRLAVRVERDSGKWSCEWYRCKLLLAFGYQQWARVDPSKEVILRAQLDALRDLGGADVPKLLRACDSRALSDLHRALLDGDLPQESWGG